MNRAFALLVAAEAYEPESNLPQLDGTIKHMESIYDWLVGVRGAAEDDIFVCSSPRREPDGWRAVRDDVRKALVALVNRAQNKGGDVFLMFSGHGFRSQQEDAAEDVFVGTDFVPMDGGKCFRLAEVLTYLNRGIGPGAHFWFVDTCRVPLDIKPGSLSPDERNAHSGWPVPHRLYSAVPGAPAWTASRFPAALRSSLLGRGGTMEWIEGKYWVTAPLVASAVQAAVQADGTEVDFQPGHPIGKIWMVDPEPPPVEVTVEVRGADAGDTFALLLLADDREDESRDFTWPDNRITVPPGDYRLVLHLGTERMRSIDPAPGKKARIYEPMKVTFDRRPRSADPSGSLLHVAVPDSSNLVLRVDGRSIWADETIPVTVGNPVDVECLEFDEPIGAVTVAVDRPKQLNISVGDVIGKSPIRQSLLKQVGREDGMNVALHLGDFMDQQGPDEGVADSHPGKLLALMGTAAICDIAPYKPLVSPLASFDDLYPGGSGVYVLASGGRGTATLQSEESTEKLRGIPDIPHASHAPFLVEQGLHNLRITLPGVTDTLIRTMALPNRVTLVVLATGGGSTRVFQFALPVGHLAHLLPPDDPRMQEFGLLRATAFSVRMQGRFADGLPVVKEYDYYLRRFWTLLTQGDWPDPLAVILAAYELLRRGGPGVGDLARLVHELFDESRFGDPVDAAALAAMLHGDEPPTDAVPLVIDGLRAASAGVQNVPESMVLCHDGPWTRWRAWTPPG